MFRAIGKRCLCGLAVSCVLAAQAQKLPPPEPPDPAPDLSPYLRKFAEVFSTIQSEAAEAPPVDKLIYGGAIPSMLRQLDPHTQFFDPAQFEQLKQMEDSAEGLREHRFSSARTGYLSSDPAGDTVE